MKAGEMIRCDFCGFEFDPACADQTCNACPLAGNCGKLACPRCGYPVLPEAALVKWTKKLVGRIKNDRRTAAVK